MSKKIFWYGSEFCYERMEKGKVAPDIGELIYEIVFVLMGLFCEKKFPFMWECHSSRTDLNYFTPRLLLKLCTIKHSAKGVWTLPHCPLWGQDVGSNVKSKKINLGSSQYSM